MKKLLLISFSFFTFSFSFSQNINTVAGSNNPGFSGDGGAATIAELYQPTGVAVDTAGNVYIADGSNNRVRKVATNGNISTIAGNGIGSFSGDGGQATAAELNDPAGVTIDKKGNVYIADYYNNCIRKINGAGVINTIAGNGTAGFSGDGGQATVAELTNPTGVLVNDSGEVYIVDANNRVRKINVSGIIKTIAGNGTPGYSGDNGQATTAELSAPQGLALDKKGNLYIADANNNRVRKVDTSGIIKTIAGIGTAGSSGFGGPATAAQLHAPSGVALDKEGNIYIADWLNNCVRKVNDSGIIVTVAGNDSIGFFGDGGPAIAAELDAPYAIAIDTTGNLYIADVNNNRIREVTNPWLTGEPELIINNEELIIYPNPSHGRFIIQLASSYQPLANSSVEVYNMFGELIYVSSLNIQHSKYNIDLTIQPSGIYLIKVQSENSNTITQKVEIIK